MHRLAAAAVVALLPAATPALDLTVGSGAARDCRPASGGVSFDAAAIAFVEPGPVTSIDAYGGGRYSPASRNDIAVGIGFGEVAADVAGYCIGAQYRADYFAVASRDLLDAVVENHFSRPFDAGRTYQLRLDDTTLRASGARLRHVFELTPVGDWSARLGVGSSVLKGLAGRQESIAGAATATSGQYAVGTATWLKTDTSYNLADFNPFVAPGPVGGYGFSTDLELIGESRNGVAIDFVVRDALGRLYWHDVPRSLQTLNNAAIRYNADFNRYAFVNGIDSRVSFTQDLPAVYHLSLTVPTAARLSLVVEDDLIRGFHFPSVAARYGANARYTELSYDIRTRAVGVGARAAFLGAFVTINSLQPQRATVLGVSLQATHAW